MRRKLERMMDWCEDLTDGYACRMNPCGHAFYGLMILAVGLAFVSIPLAVVVEVLLFAFNYQIVVAIQRVWFFYVRRKNAERHQRFLSIVQMHRGMK